MGINTKILLILILGALLSSYISRQETDSDVSLNVWIVMAFILTALFILLI